LRNDKPTLHRVLNVAREMLGPANVIEMPLPSMGSEDYAWFAERVPSAHLRIGSKVDGHETAIHRTDFQLNEKIIPLGTKLTTPGPTATPRQEIGAQNEPPMPMRLVVMADRPRHHTGTPYWRISPISATTPSMITPATLATFAAYATTPPNPACRMSPHRSTTSTSPGRSWPSA